jgi:hypothetical protein
VTRTQRPLPRAAADLPWPDPDELDHAPELAVLAALDSTLQLSLRALVALYPELIDPDRTPWARDCSLTSAAARRLVQRAGPLLRALRTYRAAVCPTSPLPPTPPDF